MTYRGIVATRRGTIDGVRIVEKPLRESAAGETRV